MTIANLGVGGESYNVTKGAIYNLWNKSGAVMYVLVFGSREILYNADYFTDKTTEMATIDAEPIS